jgi:N-acetylglucosaminyldiphosphoundecaprenol N-acetyl-beta-D-mannosaminyltransferase
MECVDILGIKISKIGYGSAMDIVEGFLVDKKKHYIVTPNPEFIVLAQKDLEFRQILNQADLAIPDGVGLRMGTRVTGVDLMLGLCGLASKKGYSVFLLGGQDGVAEEVAKRLKKRFANLNIVGTCEADPGEALSAFQAAVSSAAPSDPHPQTSRNPCTIVKNQGANLNGLLGGSSVANASSTATLQTGFAVDILFVAYGAPRQEKWIAENLPKIPVKVAMGVGGAFDFIAGRKKRAPLTLRRLGLEWFWRLAQEPQRFPRILNATVKFPLLVFLHKLQQNCLSD